MVNGKLEELLTTHESWKKGLKVLEDENIHFKTRLAQILKTEPNKEQLEVLEYFQNKFLKTDEQISLLRHEIREQQYFLQPASNTNGLQLRKSIDMQKRLEVKIIIITENFDNLRISFNDYLSDNFS
ncbi:hypothetical protein [Chitinophaga sp. CF118]|uniref:hypothetical protein n=1 Tax=Chitinophaga sp. CF118 TaxID=1884367 RepID=UPI0011608E5C|nr:hypothetical protein [Chitinophaga sp. CF118]